MKAILKAKSIYDKTNTVLMGLSAIIIVLLGASITVDVLRRATVGATWPELFEITQWSLVWVVFLGTAWLLRGDGHIRVDIITSQLKPRSRIVTDIVTSCFCAVLLGFVTFYGFKLVVFDFQSGYTLYSLLKPPKWTLEIIIPIGCFMLTLQFLFRVQGNIMKLRELSRDSTTGPDGLPGGEH